MSYFALDYLLVHSTSQFDSLTQYTSRKHLKRGQEWTRYVLLYVCTYLHTELSTYEHKTRIKVCGQALKKCIFWVRVLEKHGS